MRIFGFSVLLLMLAGCLGTPELPSLDEVELAEDSANSDLVAPDKPAPETVLEELQSVENLPDVPDQATQHKPRRGLFGIFGRNKADAATEETNAIPDEAAQENAESVTSIEEGAAAESEEVAAQKPEEPEDGAASVAPRRGLLGLFGGKRRNAAAQESEGDAPADAGEENGASDGQSGAVVASVEPEDIEEPRRPRRGLFGPRRNRASEPTVTPGTVLPFGEIGVACGVRGRALGKEVERFPAKGRGYRLYDSNPSSTAPRTHYLTGFKDGCPRQFTAALALIGSPMLHEQMRYDQYNKDLPVTDADKAYERIKRRICKVSNGEHCPEKRVEALEKGMAFVTLYERFGANASWEEILLHEGKVAGSSLRKR